jgi:hypothetical protein
MLNLAAMVRSRFPRLGLAAAAAALSLAAAQEPKALAPVSGGLWEISGAPGSKAPVRQCVADVAALAQYEHSGRTCSRDIITDEARSTVIHYSCGAAGFGRSTIEVITPRSLTIRTQGISAGLPFNYVLLARRVGDCPKALSSSPH